MRIKDKDRPIQYQGRDPYREADEDGVIQSDDPQYVQRVLGGNCKRVEMSYRLFLGLHWLDKRREQIKKQVNKKRPTLMDLRQP